MINIRGALRNLQPLVRVWIAAGYTARLAIYMVDESRTGYSVLDRDFSAITAA